MKKVLAPFDGMSDVAFWRPEKKVWLINIRDGVRGTNYLHPEAWEDVDDAKAAVVMLKPKLMPGLLYTVIGMPVSSYLSYHAQRIRAANQFQEAHRVSFLERWAEWHCGTNVVDAAKKKMMMAQQGAPQLPVQPEPPKQEE